MSTLARKFSRDSEALSQTAVLLAEMAEMVQPAKRLRIFKVDPDNRVLECAEAGQAGCIVTGDKVMLQLKQCENIRLISLREYLMGGQAKD